MRIIDSLLCSLFGHKVAGVSTKPNVMWNIHNEGELHAICERKGCRKTFLIWRRK